MEIINKVVIDLNKDLVSFFNYDNKEDFAKLVEDVKIYGKNPASLDMMYIKIMTLNNSYRELCIEVTEKNLTYTISLLPVEKNGITCIECLNSMVSNKFNIKFIDDNFISSVVYSQETSSLIIASLIVILINANKANLSYSYKDIHVESATDYFNKYMNFNYPSLNVEKEDSNMSNTSRRLNRLRKTDVTRNRVSFSADQTKTSITELSEEQKLAANVVHNKESKKSLGDAIVIPMFFPQKDVEKKIEYEQRKAFDKFNDQLYQHERRIKDQENRFQSARTQKDFNVYARLLSN